MSHQLLKGYALRDSVKNEKTSQHLGTGPEVVVQVACPRICDVIWRAGGGLLSISAVSCSELEPRAGAASPACGPGLHFFSWTAHGARS